MTIDQLVFIVDLAATDQALPVASGTIVKPAPSAGVSHVEELDVVVGKKGLDAKRPGAGVKLVYCFVPLVNSPAQVAEVCGPVGGEELRHAFRVASQNTLPIRIRERLDLLAIP